MTGPHANVQHWGGYLGLATAAAAWYASFGAVVNSTFGRAVVPLFPLTAGLERPAVSRRTAPAVRRGV